LTGGAQGENGEAAIAERHAAQPLEAGIVASPFST